MVNSKIRRLAEELLAARRKVRRLELLLVIAREEARCEHIWVKRFPEGPRDNGEFCFVCTRCGAEE